MHGRIPGSRRRRYYVAYGGRGSAKSWTFATALLLQALFDPLRVLCVREIQRTISDSVHRLLSDKIRELGLEWFFTVQETTIAGANGAEFLFAGLRGIDAAKIKSIEGIDVVWCEEAQAITKKSWEILIPTIRADDSEIWVTFNPDMDTDDTYQRFVVYPPENAWVARVTWKHNDWFPPVLEAERLALKRRDPAEHDHVWGGLPRTVVEGAIYSREVTQLVEQRRFRQVPYDPSLKVHTVWDLGYNDESAIILVQRVISEVRIIGYIEDSQRTLAEYVAELNIWPVVWGKDWIPHDGGNRTIAAAGNSVIDILKRLGRKAQLVSETRPNVEHGIQLARMMFPRIYMDDQDVPRNGTGYRGCRRLLDCLKRYRRAIPTTTEEPGSPVHDEYSHGADAFRYMAMVVDQMRNDDEFNPRSIKVPVRRMTPGMGM